MADIELVIKMSEEYYKSIKDDSKEFLSKGHKVPSLYEIVNKGIPLPKGHGRLVDADAILVDPYGNTYKDIDIAETIIEADTENTEK